MFLCLINVSNSSFVLILQRSVTLSSCYKTKCRHFLLLCHPSLKVIVPAHSQGWLHSKRNYGNDHVFCLLCFSSCLSFFSPFLASFLFSFVFFISFSFSPLFYGHSEIEVPLSFWHSSCLNKLQNYSIACDAGSSDRLISIVQRLPRKFCNTVF